MLYLLHGSDTDAARAKANALLESLRAKKPDAGVFVMDDESFDAASFHELLGGQGLFERRSIVLLRRVFANKEAMEIILGKLPEVQKSENIFIIFEGKLLGETSDKFKQFSEKSQEFKLEGVQLKAKEKFNVFSLADALGRRDRKSLWVLYQKALRRGASPEEVNGILFWKVKELILASPVRSRASNGASSFSSEELRSLASRLVSLYHDSHRGLIDFETGLERFVLNL